MRVAADPAVTYTSYLRIEELLSLQHLRSAPDGDPGHDEMLFVVFAAPRLAPYPSDEQLDAAVAALADPTTSLTGPGGAGGGR